MSLRFLVRSTLYDPAIVPNLALWIRLQGWRWHECDGDAVRRPDDYRNVAFCDALP
jgi:hypothetical protein